MEDDLGAIKQQVQHNADNIAELKKRQDDMEKLVSSVAIIANEQEHMRDDVREIKADVKALTEKPGKRWEGMIEKIIFALVGGFVAWVLSGAPGLK